MKKKVLMIALFLAMTFSIFAGTVKVITSCGIEWTLHYGDGTTTEQLIKAAMDLEAYSCAS